MTKPFFFLTTIIIFATVSILHFLRLAFEMEVVVGSWNVPGWLSGLVVVTAAFMAYWAFKLSRDGQRKEEEE